MRAVKCDPHGPTGFAFPRLVLENSDKGPVLVYYWSPHAGGDTERAVRMAADPGNLEACYRLSAVHLLADEYEPAMEQLLEIARRDRGFRHDAGRTGLEALFELLGNGDGRVQRYRALLQETLH